MTVFRRKRLQIVSLVTGITAYLLIILPFAEYMRSKPVEEKLGYVPSIKLIRPLSADHKELVGAFLVMKVIMYYGGLLEAAQEKKVISTPDYQGISRILHGALELDPYNMDAYYFAQSFLTWEAKQYKLANDLLDKGMKYRTWDWYLPFFAGFNNAYFLKDFNKAAEYYRRAADLSGSELHKSLTGRYMQESGQTELAIAYLTVMVKNERNQAVKKNYQIRLAAFKEARRIEIARDEYKNKMGKLPSSIDDLIQSGLLSHLPSDPYGGQFYLESDGKVATTSKFAFGGKK